MAGPTLVQRRYCLRQPAIGKNCLNKIKINIKFKELQADSGQISEGTFVRGIG